MNKINVPINLELKFEDKNIISIKDLKTNKHIKTFQFPLTSKHPKIYIIKDKSEYFYIGITQQSIRSRFRYGFNANGETGYHGYKWKDKSIVQLFVWCFDELTSYQLESVEAELAFLIRAKTNKWPIYQNEIHFNNDYDEAKEIANSIFTYIEEKTSN